MVRVAINGFGRIGRQVFQAGFNDPSIEFVAINDLTDTKSLAYLLKYDSVHGKRKDKIYFNEKYLIINGYKVLFLNEKNPENLPWKDLKIDLVVECSGLFTKREEAIKHINAGAKRVLISAPAKDVDKTFIIGVNEKSLSNNDKILSMASCTSNCIIPMIKVLNDNFGVEKGYMVTTHAYTADQRIVDAPHKDFRRGRTACQNIVPTTTGAAKMAGEIIPELKGKIDGYALRVPVANGSICNLTAWVKKVVNEQELNECFKKASEKELKGILEYCFDPIVSTDIIHNPHSCIFDSLMTKCIDNMVNVVGWYDNEWGYSCRLAESIKLIERLK
ncbi:MAG: type I glyceraldehyde-3-phosphate dehydrogenase [Candidatus Pacearchaeota archaeon]